MKEGIEEAGTNYTCDSMTMRLRSLQASLTAASNSACSTSSMETPGNTSQTRLSNLLQSANVSLERVLSLRACTTSRYSMAPSTESKAVVSGVFQAALPFTPPFLSIFIPLCSLFPFSPYFMSTSSFPLYPPSTPPPSLIPSPPLPLYALLSPYSPSPPPPSSFPPPPYSPPPHPSLLIPPPPPPPPIPLQSSSLFLAGFSFAAAIFCWETRKPHPFSTVFSALNPQS